MMRGTWAGLPYLLVVLCLSSCGHHAQDEDFRVEEALDPGNVSSPAFAMRHALPAGRYALWQLPGEGPKQSESYVILTPHRKVFVIDGGWGGKDGVYLRAFIQILGGRVFQWFLTHPHLDHMGALSEILSEPQGIVIEQLVATLNPLTWYQTHEPQAFPAIRKLVETLNRSRVRTLDPVPGDAWSVDDVTVEILGARNPEIVVNAVNNSSLVFRIHDSAKSVLFLGDLGVQGGNKILAGPFRDMLRSDYVQMSHHGQNGVEEEFYSVVMPRYALWPTPLWLWENDDGHGRDSGKWTTLEVRRWMDALGVVNYPSFRGLLQIL